MKLFLKSADKKLFENYRQHAKDGTLENQDAIVKIFNPYGAGTWYIINSDPDDPNYLWAIVVLDEVEIGSVLRSDLENIRFGKFQLPLEREFYFEPINAEKLYKKLLANRLDDYGDLEPTKKEPKMTVVKDKEHYQGKVYDDTTKNLMDQLKERIKNRKYEYTPKPEALEAIKKGIEKCQSESISINYIKAFVLGTLVTTEGEKEGMYTPELYTIMVQYIPEHFNTFIDNTKANWFQAGWKYLEFDIKKMQNLGFRIHNSNKEIKSYNTYLKKDVISKYQIWISQDFRHVFTVGGFYMGLVSIDTEKGFEMAQNITNEASYVKDVDYWVNGLGGMSLDNSIDELSLALEKQMAKLQKQIKKAKPKLESGGNIKIVSSGFTTEKQVEEYIKSAKSYAEGALLYKKPVVLLEQATIVPRPENFYESGSYIKKSKGKTKTNKSHYIPKFKVGDIVVNKKTNTIGIVRIADDKFEEVKTDADGNVNIDFIEKYDSTKHKGFKIAPSTKKEISNYAKGGKTDQKIWDILFRKDDKSPWEFITKESVTSDKADEIVKDYKKKNPNVYLVEKHLALPFEHGGDLQDLGGAGLNLFKAGGKLTKNPINTLEPFIKIARESKDGFDFYKKAKGIQASPEVGIKWREKYDPKNKLSIIQVSHDFVKDVHGGEYDSKSDTKPSSYLKINKKYFQKYKSPQGYFLKRKFVTEWKNKDETKEEANKRLTKKWEQLLSKYK